MPPICFSQTFSFELVKILSFQAFYDMPTPTIFLTDNGSLKPEASFRLRELASDLSSRTDFTVEPVSLLHSHKISPEKLNGKPATIVKRRLRECFRLGQREFVVVPLFLGPSLAITEYLAQIVEELKPECPDFDLRVAEPLAGQSVDAPEARLIDILADYVKDAESCGKTDRIALVDHGTPIRPVNRLRNAVARDLAKKLGREVQPCSMERRDGDEYAFNDPLLENLSAKNNIQAGSLFLAMFFILPGRHAGPEGDVASIAEGLIGEGRFKEVSMSPLLGEHPLLLEILQDRLASVFKNRSKG